MNKYDVNLLIFNSIIDKINKYVNHYYKEYDLLNTTYNQLPNTTKIKMYLFQSYLETEISNEVRRNIIINIMKNLNNSKLTKDHNYLFIQNAILDYYYVPSKTGSTKFSYIIDNGHLGKQEESEKILALMWYNEAGKKQIFEINNDGNIEDGYRLYDDGDPCLLTTGESVKRQTKVY